MYEVMTVLRHVAGDRGRRAIGQLHTEPVREEPARPEGPLDSPVGWQEVVRKYVPDAVYIKLLEKYNR